MLWNDSQDTFAYLIHEDTLYFAKKPHFEDLHSPLTAVTSLIQGIYEQHPDQAHFIVRNRIYTNQPQATALSYGMVKVAAKRITYGSTLPHALPPRVVDCSEWRSMSHPTHPQRKFLLDDTPLQGQDLQTLLQGPGQNHLFDLSSFKKEMMSECTDRQWMRLTHTLLDSLSQRQISRPQILSPDLPFPDQCTDDLPPCTTNPHPHRIHEKTETYTQDRSIAALLVAPDPTHGREVLLGVDLNTQSVNRTLHAEVNLIQNYFQRTMRPLPAHSKIFTTLKPCRMCAGMIWDSAGSPETLKVFYSKDDPGAHATQTVLTAHSDERKRFLKPGASTSLEVLIFLNLFSSPS